MKNLFRISLLALAIVFTSCSDDDDNQTLPAETNTIVDIVAGNPDFSTLGSALEITNLTSVLASEGPFTVFAPTNDAFADFLTEFGLSSLDQVDGLTLSQTLNTHAVPTLNIRAEALVDGTLITFGDPIIIDAANATVTDQNGRVCQITQTNLQAVPSRFVDECH